MTIQEMHFDFKVKVDKVDSLSKRNFNDAQIDWLLNEGIWIWLKTTYGLSNKEQQGFEVTEHRIQDLKQLHIKSIALQPDVFPNSIDNDEWEVNLGKLEYEHLFTTRVRAKIRQGECEKIVSVSITQTDDLNHSLSDPFHKPSFKFGKVLGVYGRSVIDRPSINNLYGRGSLYLYSDNFEILEVYIDYIKYPNRVWIGSYDLTTDLKPKNQNNLYVYQAGINNPVHCDLSAHTHYEIVDVAAILASQLIEDPTLAGLKAQKLSFNK